MQIVELQLSDLVINPNQPREFFDEESLNELADSIKRHGLINPITVAKSSDNTGYIVVAGERRYQAHKILGKDTILATITEGNAEEIALIENIQRDDLNPIEEARALARLKKSRGYSQEQLADIVGKARSTVANTLGLNNLHEKVQEEGLKLNIASKSVLIELSKVKDKDAQLARWKQIKDNGNANITVRHIRNDLSAESVAKPSAFQETFSFLSPVSQGGLDSRRPENRDRTNRVSFKVRVQLLGRLVEILETKSLNREEAAKMLQTSQARLSDLYNKHAQKFSIDALINMYDAAGIPVKIEIGDRVVASSAETF